MKHPGAPAISVRSASGPIRTSVFLTVLLAALAPFVVSCIPEAVHQKVERDSWPDAQQAAASVDPFDPRVFNWRFYLNNNPDLLRAGYHDEAAARRHWLLFGIREGRQASPTFHTRQYLGLYPDLRAAYDTNFQAALRHYLTVGARQGRRGYREGGVQGRWTVANDIISVSASARTAGAVDSIVWNGHEFVNSWDHGRQVQIAVTANGWGECYNPTEAGGEYDGSGAATTSVLERVLAHGNHLFTQVRAAFWMRPGQLHAPTPRCTVARNSTLRSGYIMNKDVQVGVAGIRHAIRFLVSVQLPEDVSHLELEGPTGYLGGEFTAFYAEDLQRATLHRILSSSSGSQAWPLIFATQDGSFAMGVWSPDLPQPGNPEPYGYYAFPHPRPACSTNKWHVLFRYGPMPAGSTVQQHSYLVVGTLEDVRTSMKRLYDLWQSGRLQEHYEQMAQPTNS